VCVLIPNTEPRTCLEETPRLDRRRKHPRPNNIKNLIDELDENTFHRMVQHTVEMQLTNPETKKYGEYFQNYYFCRPTQWAHYFRKGFRKNTNMSLEKWHQ
jgi:c-di-GMP-related signal transduction protein